MTKLYIKLTRALAEILCESPSYPPYFKEDVLFTTDNVKNDTFKIWTKKEISEPVYKQGDEVKFLCKKTNIANFKNDIKKALFYVVDENNFMVNLILPNSVLPLHLQNALKNEHGERTEIDIILTEEQFTFLEREYSQYIIRKFGYQVPKDKPAVHLGEAILKNQSKILAPDEYERLLSFINNKENQELAFGIINNCNYKENLHYLLNIFSSFTKEQRKSYDKKYPNFNTAMSYHIEEWRDFDTINLDLMIPVVRKFFPQDNKEKIDFLIKNYNYVARK